MRQAKINVIRNYLLVGVTEELEDFLFALEALLPEFFKGVLNVYKAPGWMRVCVCVFFFFNLYGHCSLPFTKEPAVSHNFASIRKS